MYLLRGERVKRHEGVENQFSVYIPRKTTTMHCNVTIRRREIVRRHEGVENPLTVYILAKS